jgi:hypothetical protein
MPTINQLIDGFIEARNKKRAVVARHKEELVPYNDVLNRLETGMQAELLTQGVQNIKGQHGTCYLSKKITAKVEDWEVTLAWIIANNMQHMLVRQVSKDAVAEFADAQGELPPGVSMNSTTVTNVRTS